MSFTLLATDYDGTIATHGVVDDATLAALRRLRASGKRVIMVTGREIEDLKTVFPHLDAFDLIVGENGALLYWPADGREVLLATPPPPEFGDHLRKLEITPLSIGRVIVATFEPHDQVVLETIKQMGLELQVIFNKGSVMVLPTGVNKATGLKAALKELNVPVEEVVGFGDAENDHAFLDLCGCSVAVANALPSLKSKVNIVTKATHGAGVTEVIERWLAGELTEVPLKKSAVLEPEPAAAS